MSSSEILLKHSINTIPEKLAESIEREFIDIESRFSKGDWKSSEISGGLFGEAVMRYLEWKNKKKFTPIGLQLNRSTILGETKKNTLLTDGIRIHIPNCLNVLMDIRNKRYVGHLGNDIDVREMDAVLVYRLSAWILSEIIREERALESKYIQKIIDRLSKRKIPFIEEIDGHLLVLVNSLTAKNQVFVALYKENPINLDRLRNAVQYKNSTRFRKILEECQKERLIYIKEDLVHITSKGIQKAEQILSSINTQ